MAELFTNNAESTLAGAITNVATSLTVQGGDGANFPSPTGGDFFRIKAIRKSDGAVEFMTCTSRSTDTFTITRGEEGTTGLALAADDYIQHVPTAAFYTSMATVSDIQDGSAVYAAGSGSADVQTVTLDPVPAALTDGMEVRWLPTANNTGACTLNVNSLGATDVKKIEGGALVALAAGDLDTNYIAVAHYLTAASAFILATAPPLATKAETETGTSTRTGLSPANLYRHPYVCKAWAFIDSVATTPSVDAGENISGCVRDGTGQYTITMTNAQADAYYCVIATADSNSGIMAHCMIAPAKTTTTFTIQTRTVGNGTVQDANALNIVVYGNRDD